MVLLIRKQITMSTAKELRESALKYGCEYKPKPEAIEVVEWMFNNCIMV